MEKNIGKKPCNTQEREQRTNKADCTSVHVQDSQIEPNSTPHWLEAHCRIVLQHQYWTNASLLQALVLSSNVQ